MTREEILAMEAGRELDALVAVKIIGLEVEEKEDHLRMYVKGTRTPILTHSTDISAAWRVVEKVTEEKHCHCEVKVYPGGFANVKFTKVTGPFTSDEVLGCAGIDNDETITEAICKAALLAKL